MIVTVSNENGIKQYNVPEQIKGILLVVVIVLFLVIGTLSFYVKSLNDKLTLLEKDIKIEKIVEKSNKDYMMYLSKDTKPKLQQQKSLQSDLVQIEANKIKKINEESEKLKVMALKKANEEKLEKERVEKEKIQKEKLLKLTEERKKREEHLKRETAIQLAKLAKEKAKKKRLDALKIEKEKKRKKEKLAKAKAKKEKLAKEKLLKLAALKKAKAKKEKLLKLKKEKAKKFKKEKAIHTHKITQNKKKYKSNNKLNNLPEIAKSKLGKRYVWGAVGPSVFDCSGFTSYVYKKTGIRIPRTSRQQSKYGKLVDRKHLKPGDLIFFDTSHSRRGIVNHVGMYIGNNQFIHASSAKKRVVITKLSNFYSQRFKWARRVIN